LVAGVQAQLLSITLGLDPAASGARECYYVGLIGLLTEITGTFCGGLHLWHLQRWEQRGKQALDYMEECKANLKITMKYVARNSVQLHCHTSPPNPRDAKLKGGASSPREDDLMEDGEPSILPLPRRTPLPRVEHPRGFASNLPPNFEDPNEPSHSIGQPNAVHHTGNTRWNCENFINSGRDIQSNYMYGDITLFDAEDHVETCKTIVGAVKHIITLFGQEAPKPLLVGIDSVIGRVYSIKNEKGEAEQPSKGNGPDATVTESQLKYVQLPTPNKQVLPFERVALNAMAFGVPCLQASITLFAVARIDALGAKVGVLCLGVGVISMITICFLFPFIR
jgi:hypothetical protein